MNVTINIPSITINLVSAEVQAGIAAIPTILRNTEKIIMNEQEALAQLQSIKDTQAATNTVLDKVSAETTDMVVLAREQAEKIAKLQDQIANMPTSVPASVSALIDELSANAQSMKDKAESIDQKVDDKAPNPTPTPPEEPGDETGNGVGPDGNPL